MKSFHGSRFPFAILIAGALLATLSAFAQTIVTHTDAILNLDGIVSEVRHDAILVRSESSPVPITYDRNGTTVYVDEKGGMISIDSVKPGQPVTIYYLKTGRKLAASKIVARPAAIVRLR